MKYLIMEDFSGKPAPFIFPDRVSHEDMRDQLPYIRAISAGTMRLDGNAIICEGGCPELGLAAGVGDAEFISRCLAES